MDNQRWNQGRDSYRPAGEVIRTADYDVAPIATDNVARRFVELHHYSGTYPAARERFGLYRQGDLVGVAVFSHPSNDKVLTNTFPTVPTRRSVELGRFVLLDEVPGNGETWFLARCFELLRRDNYAGVVSFSDPVARTSADGRQLFPGHIGTIYQASNAKYLGRGTARTLRLLPNGLVLSDRTLQKIRAGERGWFPGAQQLVEQGAAPIELGADAEARRAWLAQWLPELTRPLRHPGNHKYAWTLAKRIEMSGTPLSYPKKVAA
jgi:hypothetical protein